MLVRTKTIRLIILTAKLIIFGKSRNYLFVIDQEIPGRNHIHRRVQAVSNIALFLLITRAKISSQEYRIMRSTLFAVV